MKFGDVGIEDVDGRAHRKVMWLVADQVLILFTDVPEDALGVNNGVIEAGLVTYAIKNTEWGIRGDLETAEMLDIYSKDPKNPPELLR